MSVVLERADWERLRAMRASFLEAESRFEPHETPDYFRSRRDVEIYDATFARRIGWKWAAVLRELCVRAPQLRPEVVLDWGCGSGAATRALLASPFSAAVRAVRLWDRSTRARDFARKELHSQRPDLDIQIVKPGQEGQVDLFLASHVLDELDLDGEASLRAAARRATSVVFVESGSRPTSQRLGHLRAALLDEFAPLAPCTHASGCAALDSEAYWCHFFARPPADVFMDSFWSEFARELGVDLRSLPYSFFAATKQPTASEAGWSRILGRPRLLKGRALVDACSADGVETLSLLERLDRALFKSLDGASNDPRVWRVAREEKRIVGVADLMQAGRAEEARPASGD